MRGGVDEVAPKIIMSMSVSISTNNHEKKEEEIGEKGKAFDRPGGWDGGKEVIRGGMVTMIVWVRGEKREERREKAEGTKLALLRKKQLGSSG